ncbi:MAG: ribbon-helix-helix domain-containing protein [Acidimicrobiia bacterium]
MTSSTAYWLSRGFRIISMALPVDLVVEFDRRVHEEPFRSRWSLATRALRHYLDCPDADWEPPKNPAD